MPGIMRTGGIHVTDDILKIRDVVPSRPMAPAGAKPLAKPDLSDEFEELNLDAEEDNGGEMRRQMEEPAYESAPSVAGLQSAIKEEIVQGAMAEASRIIEDAVRSAEGVRDEYLAEARAEVDRLREDAVTQGRQQGLAGVADEVRQAANNLEGAVARFEGERAGFEAEYEEQLKWMAIEISQKVLAKKVSADDTELLEMVQKAVQSVKNEPWIRVEVAQEMTGLIDRLTALFAPNGNIEVSAVPAEPGAIQIETPSGVVDASLKTQLENLREYFATTG